MLDDYRFRELKRTVRHLLDPMVRRVTGLAWVEGPRALVLAVDYQRRIHTVVVCERLLRTVVAQMMVRRLRRAGTHVAYLSPEQYRELSRTPRASGVALVLYQHWMPLEQLAVDFGQCWVAVSKMRSAGNLGTIIRTAQAAGAAGLIILDDATDPFDTSVLRGSISSVLSLVMTRTTLPALIDWAQRHRVSLVGTSPGGSDLYTAEIPCRTILLFGEERQGLTRSELDACSMMLRIPMKQGTDSINVAVAAGVVLFEWRRQSHENMRSENTT